MPRLRPAIALAAVVVVAAVLPAVPELVRPGLPALRDATGLSGAGLVAADGGSPEVVRLSAAGQQRAYLLARARRVARGADPSVLLVLPAANKTVQETYRQLGLDALRDHGLSVVVASAVDSWNAGTCCGGAAVRGVDDVAALQAITDHAVERADADAGRVAVLGYSTGGFMVYRLLCERSLRLRAAVEVAGSLATDCPPQRDLPPVLALHGSEDTTVPLAQTATSIRLLGVVPLAVREAVGRLAAAAGCRPQYCPVRFAEIAGAGHSWEDVRPLPRIALFLRDTVPGVR